MILDLICTAKQLVLLEITYVEDTRSAVCNASLLHNYTFGGCASLNETQAYYFHVCSMVYVIGIVMG